MASCDRCGHRLMPQAMQCSSCGAWNTGDDVTSRALRTVMLSDASVSPVERFRTGPWDASLGGGIARTQTFLLGGEPGAGKTTLLFQICDELCEQTNRPALYVAGEQGSDEIRTNAERIGVRHLDRLCIAETMGFGTPEDLPAILRGMIREMLPVAVVVDSLPVVSGHNELFAKELCASLKKDALTHRLPIFLLAHVNKELTIAGLKQHEHMVDAVGILEKDEKTEIRRLRMFKNRFGSTMKRTCFEMTERHGLSWVKCPEEKEEKNT